MRTAAQKYISGLALIAIIAGFPVRDLAATGSISDYEGAWIDKVSACDDVFIAGLKGPIFRKPLNFFMPAFIISGDQLQTPQVTCKINDIKRGSGFDLFDLSCANAVAAAPMSARLSLNPDGTLSRFVNEHDKIGGSYVRCSK